MGGRSRSRRQRGRRERESSPHPSVPACTASQIADQEAEEAHVAHVSQRFSASASLPPDKQSGEGGQRD